MLLVIHAHISCIEIKVIKKKDENPCEASFRFVVQGFPK